VRFDRCGDPGEGDGFSWVWAESTSYRQYSVPDRVRKATGSRLCVRKEMLSRNAAR